MADFAEGFWFEGLQNPTRARIKAERPSILSHVRRMGSIRDGHQSRFSQEHFAKISDDAHFWLNEYVNK